MAVLAGQKPTITWRFKHGNFAGVVRAEVRRRYLRAVDAARDLLPEITAWLKENAPWDDDTGAARRSLEAVLEDNGRSFRVIIQGGGSSAPHVVFLEFDHAGRYSIIGPAFEYWAPRIAAVVHAAVVRR